jgi:putative tricarboxylic transport membrane protein
LRINDAILGIITIALSIFIIIEARSFPALPGVPYGPGVFPTIIAGCMIIGGLVLIFKGIWNLRDTGWFAFENWAKASRTYITLSLIFSALLFYILFSEALGFPIASVLILFPLFLWTRGLQKFTSSLIISVTFSLAIYLIFVKLMRVPLPSGLLQGLL